jgi:hypothetical protein
VPTTDGVEHREAPWACSSHQVQNDVTQSGGLRPEQRAGAAATLKVCSGMLKDNCRPRSSNHGSSSAGKATCDLVVLSFVLRTLVHLTSHARGNSPVRQVSVKARGAALGRLIRWQLW